MDEKGAGASSNLEQGADVRVRPESRLRDTKTLIRTQWMDVKMKACRSQNPNKKMIQHANRVKTSPVSTCT